MQAEDDRAIGDVARHRADIEQHQPGDHPTTWKPRRASSPQAATTQKSAASNAKRGPFRSACRPMIGATAAESAPTKASAPTPVAAPAESRALHMEGEADPHRVERAEDERLAQRRAADRRFRSAAGGRGCGSARIGRVGLAPVRLPHDMPQRQHQRRHQQRRQGIDDPPAEMATQHAADGAGPTAGRPRRPCVSTAVSAAALMRRRVQRGIGRQHIRRDAEESHRQCRPRSARRRWAPPPSPPAPATCSRITMVSRAPRRHDIAQRQEQENAGGEADLRHAGNEAGQHRRKMDVGRDRDQQRLDVIGIGHRRPHATASRAMAPRPSIAGASPSFSGIMGVMGLRLLRPTRRIHHHGDMARRRVPAPRPVHCGLSPATEISEVDIGELRHRARRYALTQFLRNIQWIPLIVARRFIKIR